MPDPSLRGIRLVQVGLVANILLAAVKATAGVLGHTYALVADAVESMADVLGSLVVWGGLRVASRDPDDAYPFGYGKADSLAGLAVSVMLMGAALWVGLEAVREIRTPHLTPAPWTLAVLVTVILVKFGLFRRVLRVSDSLPSTAVRADAWHHASDAVTSAAAFVGITIALWGGPGWESADDWAALLAAGVIAWNATSLARRASGDLMDRAPDASVVEPVARAARDTSDVRAIEKLNVRKTGLVYHVDIHVQADPTMSLHDAHILSGRVKRAIMAAVPEVSGVLVHMEPFEGDLIEPDSERPVTNGVARQSTSSRA
jgi:cation diffusion facilitator family transporter